MPVDRDTSIINRTLTDQILDLFLENLDTLRASEQTTGFLTDIIGLCQNLVQVSDTVVENITQLASEPSATVSSIHQNLPNLIDSFYVDENCSLASSNYFNRFEAVLQTVTSEIAEEHLPLIPTRVRFCRGKNP